MAGDRPVIKIFVSHRIDINSELVDNPLYVPVRCGAVYDKENPMHILGDDTGENISDLRMSFCEFTVQYWAWKNAEADYYGLCHYRRYLSFSEKRYPTDAYSMVYSPVLTDREKGMFGLLDTDGMAEKIQHYDLIVSEYAEVPNIPTPHGKKTTVREMWDAYDGEFFEKRVIDWMFRLIDEKSPEYSRSAREYFSGARHRGFNCYVMRRELFDRLCRFQFPIMFEIARRLDTTGYTQTMLRTPAFVGEMLYGIFTYHITTREQWRVCERQLVFFRDTERIHGTGDLIRRRLWYAADRTLRRLIDPAFPIGSRRREQLKNFLYAYTPAKRRGVANIKKK